MLWPEAVCIRPPWQLYLSLWMNQLAFGLFGCLLSASKDGPDQLRDSDEVELLNQSAKDHTLGLVNSLLRMTRTNIYRKNSGRIRVVE